MAWGQPLGLDELMIVNPSSPDAGSFFLGEDGMLYQVQGLGRGEALQGCGQLFLGEDGTVYQVQGLGQGEGGQGQFFLGTDGILYQVQEGTASGLGFATGDSSTCRCHKR